MSRYTSHRASGQTADLVSQTRQRAEARRDWLADDIDLLDVLLNSDQLVPALLLHVGVDVTVLRLRTEEYLRKQPTGTHNPRGGEWYIAMSDPVQDTMVRATAMARLEGRPISTVDVLLALMAEGNCRAAVILREAGVDVESLLAYRSTDGDASEHAPRQRMAADGQAARVDGPTRAMTVPAWILTALVLVIARLFARLRFWVLFLAATAAVVAFLPGAIGLLGFRAWIARTVRSPYRIRLRRPFAFHDDGSGSELAATPWRRTAMRLLPHLFLLLIGFLLVTPYMIQFVGLHVSPVPGLSRNPEYLLSAGLLSLGFNIFIAFGAWDFIRLWAGLSCWFWAVPPYMALRDVRWDLRNAVVRSGVSRWTARAARVLLAPLAAILRPLGVVDELAKWAGAGVMIATSGFFLVVLVIIESLVLSLMWPTTNLTCQTPVLC
jgi:hypothetical protein